MRGNNWDVYLQNQSINQPMPPFKYSNLIGEFLILVFCVFKNNGNKKGQK